MDTPTILADVQKEVQVGICAYQRLRSDIIAHEIEISVVCTPVTYFYLIERIHYSCEDGIDKSVPHDHLLSSVGTHDANR